MCLVIFLKVMKHCNLSLKLRILIFNRQDEEEVIKKSSICKKEVVIYGWPFLKIMKGYN